MKKLPDHIRNKIRPGLTVRWSGRRAVFEVIEEVSEATFRIWIVISIGIAVHQLFPDMDITRLAIVIAIICLIAAHRAILELLTWFNEIHVVCADEERDGGRVFKFTGFASQRSFSEPITAAMPTIDVERPWYFRLWGYVTGEKMERVRLYSANHTFLEGRKMHPNFYFALMMVGGSKPLKSADEHGLTNQDLTDALRIAHLLQQDAIDKQLGREAIRAIVQRAAFK
jgi:hypothetical protein